jgi:hypothetical protein
MMRARRLTLTVLATVGVIACSAAPALADAPEAPVTEPASSVTASTAVLEGVLNPHSSASVHWSFAYSPDAFGPECRDAFRTGDQEAQGEALPESTEITGLEANRKYTACLTASNEEGETPGNEVSFQTLAAPPAVQGESVVEVTPFAAILVAEPNAENESTSCVFEYGLAPGEYRVPCEPATIEGGAPFGVSFSLTKLTPATTYHYRVSVKNATGETTGPDETFQTPPLEKPILLGAFVLAPATAEKTTIEGLLDPNHQPVLGCEVQYVPLHEGFGGTPASVPCQANNPPENTFGEGENYIPWAATLTGLQRGASYEWRILATNNSGTAEEAGPETGFNVPPAPLVTAAEAQSVTRTTATLPGTVNPEGLETFYYYQYGTSTSYGGNAPSIQGVNAGSGLEAVSAPIGISGLVPATTYHYRLAATNADGTTYSSPDRTFTTAPPTPPAVSTGEASNVTLTTATVAGTINPEGLETSYELDLGTDTTYGTSLYGEAGAGSAPTEVTVSLQNLAPASAYHYRMVAINSDGRTYGADRTFTTPVYSNPIVQPPGLPLLQTPAIAFPTETVNTGKPNVKKHTKKSKHKKPKHKKKHKKKK